MYSYFLKNLFIHFGSNSDKSFACLKYSLSISHIVLGFCGFFLVLCIVLSPIQLSESYQLAEEERGGGGGEQKALQSISSETTALDTLTVGKRSS